MTQLWDDEVQVNTTTEGTQARPSVAVLADGSYVVVWEDRSSGQGDIRGQRYGANGWRLGEEFVVNGQTAGDQTRPTVTARPDGGFTMVWTDGEWMEHRHFDADGNTAMGDYGLGGVLIPSNVSSASLAAGGRVDVYSQSGQIHQARWNPDGTLANSGTVNTTAINDQISPDVVQLAGGRYVVTWATEQAGDTNIRARLFEANGTAVGPDFLVNVTAALGTGLAPQVTALTTGGFVIVWNPTGSSFPGSGYDIRGRMFDGNGGGVGFDFLVNMPTAGHQVYPEVVGLADGGFLALWGDNAAETIRGQRYDGFGARVGGSFVVSTGGESSVSEDGLSAALMKDGRVVVTWEATLGGGSDDPDGEGVRSVIIDPRGGFVEGGGGAETLYGGFHADQITAQGGNDFVWAGEGADLVFGGDGYDNLYGGGGDDVVRGQGSIDLLVGDGGDDSLYGGQGDDTLSGGTGADWLEGGAGIDTVSFGTALAKVSINRLTGAHTGDAAGDVFAFVERFALSVFDDAFTGGAGSEGVEGWVGNDVLRGGLGNDTLHGGEGNDALHGDEGLDLLEGEAGRDKLYGGAEDDSLLGGADNDTLEGGAGNDRLTGGAGRDVLTGGDGADVFLFLTASDSGTTGPTRDVIGDFGTLSGDVIDLSAIDAVQSGVGDIVNDPFTQVAAFTGVAGQLRVGPGGGGAFQLLQGDVNGDGVADFAIQVTADAPLAADDLVL